MGPDVPDRLDFLLPEFTRIAWVSEAARRTWEPRFRRIRSRWSEIEWRSVADGIRDCALIPATEEMLASTDHQWQHAGLHGALLPSVDLLAVAYGHATNMSRRGERPAFAIGSLDRVREIQEEVAVQHHDEIGNLLGYPSCCRRFFLRVRVEQQCVDTTWAMMTASVGDAGDGSRITDERCATVFGPFETNVLWRQLGIRPVPHLPCKADCAESRRLAEALLDVGTRHGYGTEVAWMKEILAWPVEWSALHGIAEIKTPILRISTRTDATASKYSVNWRRLGEVDEATGLPRRLPVSPHILQI
jgi:hypothetical protein